MNENILKNKSKSILYAILSVILWSTVATAFKVALGGLDYLLLLLISSITSWLVLFIAIIFGIGFQSVMCLSVRELLPFALLGFLNPFLYYVLLFNAYSLLKAQEALVLNYTWAVMLVIFSVPILRQKIKWNGIMSVLVSFIGVIIVATNGEVLSMQFKNTVGIAFALLSAVVWSLYWLFSAKLEIDRTLVLFMNFTFGIFYIFIFQFFNDFDLKFESVHFFAAVYIGLFEMGLTFLFWLTSLKLAERTELIANLIFLTPFLSLIFINFVLGEKINYSTLIGLFFVIFGIIISKLEKK